MSAVPSDSELMWVFAEKPQTTFVAISRATVARVNEVALKHFFGGQMPLMTVPGDPEANPDNFEGSKQIAWEPLQMPVYVGMRVALTRNIDKAADYVNGMTAFVTGVYRSGVHVQTATGYRPMVYPWTDKEYGQSFFPMRPGYATTLLKIQGATLEHLTIYLDVANVEAAGYVALSRVRKDADWQFVGDPGVHHFTPATGWF